MNAATKSGTIGGTLLTIAATIQQEDIIRTMILAAIGAAVSFGVSHVLNELVKRRKQ